MSTPIEFAIGAIGSVRREKDRVEPLRTIFSTITREEFVEYGERLCELITNLAIRSMVLSHICEGLLSNPNIDMSGIGKVSGISKLIPIKELRESIKKKIRIALQRSLFMRSICS